MENSGHIPNKRPLCLYPLSFNSHQHVTLTYVTTACKIQMQLFQYNICMSISDSYFHVHSLRIQILCVFKNVTTISLYLSNTLWYLTCVYGSEIRRSWRGWGEIDQSTLYELMILIFHTACIFSPPPLQDFGFCVSVFPRLLSSWVI